MNLSIVKAVKAHFLRFLLLGHMLDPCVVLKAVLGLVSDSHNKRECIKYKVPQISAILHITYWYLIVWLILSRAFYICC